MVYCAGKLIVRGTQRGTQRRFLLNTLKTLFRLSRELLDLEKCILSGALICICSVVLGELGPFRNYKGLSIIFAKILDEIQRITKMRHFLIPLAIKFLNPKILGSLFSTKNSLLLTWEVKCEN